MALTLITPPSDLPVPLAELRQHLWNIFDNHDTDELMTELLSAATARAEVICSRKLVTQTWRMTARGAVSGLILPFGNFQEVVSASWTTDGVTWTPIAAGDIFADDSGALTEVELTWPDEDIRMVRVDWKCGYGAADDVPADIKMAIKQLAAHWYRMRSATSLEEEDGTPRVVPFSFTAMLQSYRLNFVG
jgi:uncharacterized phiE125 gp8 family phage protein